MVYTRNQPIATDDLSVSQPLLAANTNSADDSFGINHFQFSDLTVNNGKHKYVTMPDLTSSPPITVANECSIYAKTISSQTFPFLRRDALATDIPVIPNKAFAECSLPGGGLTLNSYNITSVTPLSGGLRFQFNFTVPFPDTNYAVLCSIASVGGSTSNVFYELTSKLTTSVVIQIGNPVGPQAITLSILRA